jgi:hypothetical protein
MGQVMPVQLSTQLPPEHRWPFGQETSLQGSTHPPSRQTAPVPQTMLAQRSPSATSWPASLEAASLEAARSEGAAPSFLAPSGVTERSSLASLFAPSGEALSGRSTGSVIEQAARSVAQDQKSNRSAALVSPAR